jgi:glycosyltransferase involved in cell wall biosynthesis
LPPLRSSPLVSVLAANYNYASYLSESIDSALHQSYAKLEFIICDDGSTDDSRAILDRYHSADPRVQVILQQNAGQAAALNAAFAASHGEIICFLDSDDLYAPEKLASVVEALTAVPSAGFLVHKLTRVDASRRRRLGEIPLAFDLPSGWLGPTAPLDAPWVPPGMPPCSALCLRREVAERIFALPVGLRAFADTAIQVLAPLITPVVALDRAMGEYRIHGENAAAVSKLTESHLRRLVDFDDQLWTAWRAFLIASSCKHPIPSEAPSTQNSYVYARFRGDPAAKDTYRAFVTGPRFRGLPAMYRLFWRVSARLPDGAFRKAVELVQGQRSAKLLLAHALRKIRRIKDVKYAFDGPSQRACPKAGKPAGN